MRGISICEQKLATVCKCPDIQGESNGGQRKVSVDYNKRTETDGREGSVYVGVTVHAREKSKI